MYIWDVKTTIKARKDKKAFNYFENSVNMGKNGSESEDMSFESKINVETTFHRVYMNIFRW